MTGRPKGAEAEAGVTMKCAECGSQTSDATEFCVQCGVPIAGLRSAADPVAGGLGDDLETVPALAAAMADNERKPADIERESADLKQKIADIEREIDYERMPADIKREIADLKQKIADGEREIADNEREIAYHKRAIADNEPNIVKGLLLSGLMIVAGAALFVLPAHSRAFTLYSLVGGVVTFVLAMRYSVLDGTLRSHLPDQITAWAMWRIAVIMTIFIGGLPAIMVVLATSGGSPNAVIELGSRQTGGDLWRGLELLCVFGIPVLLVAGPLYLNAKGRAAAASSLVSGWLAGFASVLTTVFIVVLRFDEPAQGGLGKVSLAVWSVAAFGVAVLLAPFYRIVVKASLEGGVVAAFDPERWWSAWCRAFREMRGKPAVTAEAGAKAQAEAVSAEGDGTAVPDGGQNAGETGSEPEASARHAKPVGS